MTEITVPIGQWRALPKDGWHPLIRQWNRRRGFLKKVPRVVPEIENTGFLTPQEQSEIYERRKKKRRVDVLRTPKLEWEEIMTRLPYRFSDDKQSIIVDGDFAELVKLQTAAS